MFLSIRNGIKRSYGMVPLSEIDSHMKRDETEMHV